MNENEKKLSEEETTSSLSQNTNPTDASDEAVKAEQGKVTLEELYEDESNINEDESTLSPAANFFDWIKSFLFSLTAVIFIFTLIFRGVTVSGDSMLPTLHDKEYLMISSLFYTPKTGDIVVLQSPNYKDGTEPLIKRVIAVGGQKLKINFKTWEVWVDGELLEEDYIFFEEGYMMNPEDMKLNKDYEVEITLPENEIFVMGDHRNDSLDSRSTAIDTVDERYIMGRVLFRITPLEKFGKVE